MAEMMTAYRLLGWQRPPELVQVPVPSPGPGQVVVEVAGCGLCHSDLTMVEMGADVGEALGWVVPFTLGHETAGRVAEVGRGVDAWAPGDAVALASPSSCGVCQHCRSGRDSACRAGAAGRGFGRDGGLAAYVLVEAERELLPLGDLDPRHAGPLTDAGATTMHAVRRVRSDLGPGGLGPDSTVAVVGIGGLGSFAVQILRATIEARIVGVDIAPERRELALRMGAHDALDGAVDGLHRELRALGGGEDGLDAVIDVVGTDATIASGLRALRRGGSFVLVGAGGGGFARPWFGGLPREATISTVQGSSLADAREVIGLAAEGRVRVETEDFPLAEVARAYAALAEGTLRGRAVVVP